MSCNVPGSAMDLSRITAVEGLTAQDCGTVLKVTSTSDPSKFEYVMAVDSRSRNLDLNSDTFHKLFGERQSVGQARWEVVNSRYGDGIVTGEYDLPGYEKNLNLPL
ncbi:hypothetical protein ACWZEH_00660 [Streptomyces sp. QTS137]